MLIGGGACLFYRARLAAAGDPDFRVAPLDPETERLWLSKDLDFTGVFSGEAMELVPHLVVCDAAGHEYLEVEGVRLGFAQVGLVLDPERALETARTGEFETESGTVEFLVADPVTLFYLEKQALVQRRGQPGHSVDLALLHDYVAWEVVHAAERLLAGPESLSVGETRHWLALLTDAAHRAWEITRDPRLRRRLVVVGNGGGEMEATLVNLLELGA